MIELQRKLLGDTVRNSAFAEAIERTVHRGSVVIDAGSGTGFLSMLAARRGAKCHLIEEGAVMSLAKRMARENGFDDFSFHHSHSSRVKAKIRADVLITETLGNFAYEENIIETVADAKRFLKPNAHIIPSSIRNFAAPVIDERVYHGVNVWDTVGYEIDMSAARTISLNNMYVRKIAPASLLDGEKSVRQWDEVDFSRHSKSIRRGSIRWRVPTGVTVYGFCLFWECTLAEDIILSTSPFADDTHWDQIFLPLLMPIVMPPHASLSVTIVSNTEKNGVIVGWRTSVLSGERELSVQDMSTENGILV
ncbi:MAG: methyltransferase domain-containing protein [Spirochaetota bacterium]